MRLQYTSSSSSSTSSLAAGLAPCLLPGPGSGLAGGGCSCCWGCCYGALLFFLWTSAAVTASSSSSSSSSAGGAGAGGAAVTGAPGSAGSSGAAASTHSPAPPLPAAVVAGGALLAAVVAGAGGGGVLSSSTGGALCYSSPSAGSVQELAQRSRVVIEGKVQQQQAPEGRKRKVPEEGDFVTSGKRRGQVVKGQVNGTIDKHQTVSVVVSTASQEQVATANSWTAPSAGSFTTTATIALSGFSDFTTFDGTSSSVAPGIPESYLVKVHQVWAVKSAGLEKDSIITVQGDFGSSCLKLKEDSRYIFFMDPTNSSSVFRASFPPLETGRNMKKDVGRVLCRGCECGLIHLWTYLCGPLDWTD
ncbi:pro-neuregulin-2, membrane-bound isoform-like [Hyla sarda]|uniref:pro-neuregulin-2, membrane-bound isoform-like n=1 Tax=Hyla sarda TaxID=327740 RepID=UPI0024C25A3F|nr:pro-neuregulin-2, membrane-bound isoform-like [Hyla sarda]